MNEHSGSGGKRAPQGPASWTPERPQRRGAAPSSLADVLVGAQAFLAEKSGTAIPREEWKAIVGDRIAGRTRVGKNWKGTLTIKVASSAWSNELSLLKSDILHKLQRAGRDIHDLKFRVDKIASAPRPRKTHAFKSAPQIPQPIELPPALLARLQTVEDPNLRAAIAEAARASLSPKK